jgi:hypothetical protein
VVAQVLPDRERRHLLQFYLVPRLGYRTRLALAGGLIGVGFAIQLLVATQTPGPLIAITAPLLFVGNLFLLVRGYNLKPSQSLYGGDWEKTTRDRFQEIRKLENQVKRWDQTFADLTCVPGVLCLIGVAGAVAAIWYFLQAADGTRFWGPVFLADAMVLLLPHWVTGTRRGWRPTELVQQVESLETAVGVLDGFDDPPCQIQPMLQLAGCEANRTPMAARVFVRFPDGPEELLGLQFQVALNDVQGTKYPYLYAVVIAKKSFGLLREHLAAIRKLAPGLTVEPSKEQDVEVVVIRRPTTKTSGYHTEARMIRRIALRTWQVVSHIMATESVRDD